MAATRTSAPLASTLWRHRVLLWELTRRETSERYAGSLLGAVWVLAHPIFLIALYVIVFGWIFPARMQGSVEVPRGYTVYILSGLIPWLTCADLLNRAPATIRGSSALVKQIVFPIEILPVRTTLGAFVTQGVLTALLLGYMGVLWIAGAAGPIPASALLLIPIWIMQFLLLSGLCAGIGALCVAARDFKELIQLFTTAGLFLVPVLYAPALVEGLPWPLRAILFVNPFSHLVWCAQDALYFGRIDHPWSWAILAAVSILGAWFGAALFRRLAPLFGDRL